MATDATLVGIAKALDRIGQRLDLLTDLTRTNLTQGAIEMAIGQDILDAVAAESTAVDGVIVYIQGLITNNVVTAEQGQKILSDLAANRTKLETAITTGVTPTP